MDTQFINDSIKLFKFFFSLGPETVKPSKETEQNASVIANAPAGKFAEIGEINHLLFRLGDTFYSCLIIDHTVADIMELRLPHAFSAKIDEQVRVFVRLKDFVDMLFSCFFVEEHCLLTNAETVVAEKGNN